MPPLFNAANDSTVSDLACTLSMFQCWTQIDVKNFTETNFDSPGDAIQMTIDECISFARFRFYLDKDAFPDEPNKYRARMAEEYFRLSDGQTSADVVFPTSKDSTVESPNPEFLRIHASFAKVLNACGAIGYFRRNANLSEDDSGGEDGGSDLAFLSSKMATSNNNQT
ncbi:hypothetical protein VKT23_013289 [Stygiomarasmius scandens]|uniref:Uncharacterized protein n=1 Tax=Marasmiellus scandens TaxID=2682957 RepID=A0ABR1J437_9AGAR